MRRYLKSHSASGEISLIDALQGLQEAAVYVAPPNRSIGALVRKSKLLLTIKPRRFVAA